MSDQSDWLIRIIELAIPIYVGLWTSGLLAVLVWGSGLFVEDLYFFAALALWATPFATASVLAFHWLRNRWPESGGGEPGDDGPGEDPIPDTVPEREDGVVVDDWEEEPVEKEEEIPAHEDQELLEELYEEYDGSITQLYEAREFEVSQGTVRNRLIDFGIHEAASYAEGSQAAPDSEEVDADDAEVENEVVDQNDRNWCGVCGDGPFKSVARHAGHKHGGTVVALDHEPTEAELARGQILNGHTADEIGSFEDLDTPDWLDEASFYQAVDMAEDLGELQEVLGWEGEPQIETMIEVLELEEEIRLTESLAVDGGSGEVDPS